MSIDSLRKVIICGGLVVLTVLAYWRVAQLPFIHHDDNIYIFENRHVLTGLTLENTVWAFTTNYASNWHPLTWLSLQCDAQVFRPEQLAGGTHLVNLVLHVINVLLVFWLLVELLGKVWPSAWMAALFAVHPLHVESVAWAVERKDVLSTAFGLLSLIAYIRHARRPSGVRYCIVCLFLALGLMSKPMLVTFPALMLLLDYWPLKRWPVVGGRWSVDNATNPSTIHQPPSTFASLLIEKLPLMLLSLAASAVTYVIQSTTGAVSETMSLGARLQLAGWGYSGYLFKMIWPMSLAIPYPHLRYVSPAITVAQWGFLIALTLVIFWGARHGRLYALVGWLWYLGLLVPVIGFVPIGDQSMADRYMYVPMLGLLIVLTLAAMDVAKTCSMQRSFRVVATLFAVGVLTACAVLTIRQIENWTDDESLFRHAIAVEPQNAFAENDLGCAYLERNDFDQALRHLNRALVIDSSSYLAQNSLGYTLVHMGRLEEAQAHLRAAVQLKPSFTRARINLGLVLAMENRFDEAQSEFTIAIEQDPSAYQAHSNLAKLLERKGQLQEALQHFQIALQCKPDYEDARLGVERVSAKIK